MIKNSYIGFIFLLALLYACGGSQSTTKQNVLSKPNTNNTNGKQVVRRPASSRYYKNQPKQPVVTMPVEKPQEKPTVVEKPKVDTPVYMAPVYIPPVENNVQRPDGLVYRSKEYYQFMTDSLQQYVRPEYFRTIDAIYKNLSTPPSASTNPAVNSGTWNTTPNFNLRKPTHVILHHTSQDTQEQTLFTFSLTRTQVSSHYVIGRDGKVHQLLNDYLRAWHAGNSKWGSITDINSASIGIEIDNNGNERFSDVQVDALLRLLTFLKKEYGIPTANFIAHSDIAPGRKSDPSKFFPWNKLAANGFGFWYDSYNLMTPPADFNALLALRVIGYDIKNPKTAIGAFKLHYIQNDTEPTLSDYDKKVLYNIYQKFE